MNIAKKLIEGKKIRRERWQKGHYWKLKEGEIIDSSGMVVDDFEIVEDKKTLSDKIFKTIITKDCNGFFETEEIFGCNERDIKEAIKEFINEVKEKFEDSSLVIKIIDEKAKEKFGERLI